MTYQAPVVKTAEEAAFKSAYSSVRIQQELRGVVCVTPEDIHSRMYWLSVDEFETLFVHMVEGGFIGVSHGSICPKIVFWIE